MYDFNSIVEGWLVWRPTRPDRSSQSPRIPQALRETQAPHTLPKHTHTSLARTPPSSVSCPFQKQHPTSRSEGRHPVWVEGAAFTSLPFAWQWAEHMPVSLADACCPPSGAQMPAAAHGSTCGRSPPRPPAQAGLARQHGQGRQGTRKGAPPPPAYHTRLPQCQRSRAHRSCAQCWLSRAQLQLLLRVPWCAQVSWRRHSQTKAWPSASACCPLECLHLSRSDCGSEAPRRGA